ncbi:MAG: hypothetical protein RIR43_43, partial [Pseudomonadota bacterium]
MTGRPATPGSVTSSHKLDSPAHRGEVKVSR